MLKHKIKFRSNDIGLGQGFVYLSEIAFVFLPINLNLCFGCLGEASHWDGSFEHLQYRFVLGVQRSRRIEAVFGHPRLMLYLRDLKNKALRRFFWKFFTSSDKQAIFRLEKLCKLISALFS